MSSVLDLPWSWVGAILGVLPDTAATLIALPAFIVVVAVGLTLLIRKAIPGLAGPTAKVLSTGVGVVAMPFIAVILVLTKAWRMVRLRPPSVLYNADDVVVAAATGAIGAVTGASNQLRRLAKFPKVVVLVLAATLLWQWDGSYCPDGADACTSPVMTWVRIIGGSPAVNDACSSPNFIADAAAATTDPAAQPTPDPSCQPTDAPPATPAT